MQRLTISRAVSQRNANGCSYRLTGALLHFLKSSVLPTLAIALAVGSTAAADLSAPGAAEATAPSKSILDTQTGAAKRSTSLERSISAVGQLLVPAIRYENGYARHYNERCSATAVAEGNGEALYLLSAWHCLEDYRDLSRPLLFELSSGFQSPVRVVASGDSMLSDWVLLRLQAPAPSSAGIAEETSAEGSELIMAGYPRDHSAADAGPVTVLCQQSGKDNKDWSSDCVLQKGASGGAVFNPDGEILGVISRGDGESVSIFVPVNRFRNRLTRYLTAAD